MLSPHSQDFQSSWKTNLLRVLPVPEVIHPENILPTTSLMHENWERNSLHKTLQHVFLFSSSLFAFVLPLLVKRWKCFLKGKCSSAEYGRLKFSIRAEATSHCPHQWHWRFQWFFFCFDFLLWKRSGMGPKALIWQCRILSIAANMCTITAGLSVSFSLCSRLLPKPSKGRLFSSLTNRILMLGKVKNAREAISHAKCLGLKNFLISAHHTQETIIIIGSAFLHHTTPHLTPVTWKCITIAPKILKNLFKRRRKGKYFLPEVGYAYGNDSFSTKILGNFLIWNF